MEGEIRVAMCTVFSGYQFLRAVAHIFNTFGVLFVEVPSINAERHERPAICFAGDERKRSPNCCPHCGGGVAAGRAGDKVGSGPQRQIDYATPAV